MKQLKAIHDLFRFEDDLFRNGAKIFWNKTCTGIRQNIYTLNPSRKLYTGREILGGYAIRRFRLSADDFQMGDGITESLWRAIDHSSGRGQIRPTRHLEDYEVFLLYINKSITDFGRICFCFGGVLGGVTRALGESSLSRTQAVFRLSPEDGLVHVRVGPLSRTARPVV